MTSIIFLLFFCLLILSFYLFKQRKEINSLNEVIQEQQEIEEIKIIKAKLIGRDEERERIVKDWHDGIGNSLSTLRLIFDNIHPKNQDAHTEALKLLEFTIREFSVIIENEYDNSFSDEAIIIAVFQKWKQQLNFGNIEFAFNVYNLNKYILLPISSKSYLYRICQELVSNSLKHAKPTQIHLSLEEQKETLELIYSDNGIGLQKEAIAEGNFKSLRHRVRVLNGELEVDAANHNGLTIKIVIPYN